MVNILLPQAELTVQPRLVFFLAMEEYLASDKSPLVKDHVQASWRDGAFFLWQSRPTVIFGRNQDMLAEVNVPWCESHGVEMYRRKSGGGCVYSDEGNVMLSAIFPRTEPQQAFQLFLSRVVDTLRTLGLPAVSSLHNDVLVDGLKVSGNACFGRPEAAIVHGTLLWKSNMDNLCQAITPSQEKLAKHAVQSVRQRVGNLYDMGVTDLAALKKHIISSLCESEYTLAPEEVKQIREIERGYLDPAFIRGEGKG